MLKIIRGDRNELSPTFDRKLPKVQSPSSFSNGQKYSSVPAIVKLSTPEPFSYKPTVPVTQRYSSTFSTSRSYSSTKFPQTFPTTTSSTTTTTQRTTTQEPPQYYPTRYFPFFFYSIASVTWLRFVVSLEHYLLLHFAIRRKLTFFSINSYLFLLFADLLLLWH